MDRTFPASRLAICLPGGNTIPGEVLILGCFPSALSSGVSLQNSERGRTWQLNNDDNKEEEEKYDNNDIYWAIPVWKAPAEPFCIGSLSILTNTVVVVSVISIQQKLREIHTAGNGLNSPLSLLSQPGQVGKSSPVPLGMGLKSREKVVWPGSAGSTDTLAGPSCSVPTPFRRPGAHSSDTNLRSEIHRPAQEASGVSTLRILQGCLLTKNLLLVFFRGISLPWSS